MEIWLQEKRIRSSFEWSQPGRKPHNYFCPVYVNVSLCALISRIQMIQKNGYNEENLNDGPESSWLGYSLLPKGYIVTVTT